MTGAGRRDGVWHLETRAGLFSARLLVDAAGAWADEVAKLAGVAPIGITPIAGPWCNCAPTRPCLKDFPMSST